MEEHDHNTFLQDKNFIAWRLTGDSSLTAFWKQYLALHPEQKDAFEKAIQQFSIIKLNPERLIEAEENLLLDRIHCSVRGVTRKKHLLHLLKYAAVACVLITISLIFYHPFGITPDITPMTSSVHLPTGDDLEKKDIFLITDSKTTSFTKDVCVQINEKGTVTVQEADGSKPTVINAGKAVMNKLVVPYGKRSQLILSDGSKVWVNSGSVLEFPSAFTGHTRTVNLTGEMFIEVAKDHKRPFYVHTPDLQVKVYGTRFNISAYPDDKAQSVVLVSGNVGVKSVNDAETYLQPSEMLLYNGKRMEKKKVDTARYTSWKDGYIIMEQTPISDVLKIIERYYNLSFEIRDHVDLASRTCDGKLYLSDNLDNVMKTISILSSIQYTRDGRTIYIDINP